MEGGAQQGANCTVVRKSITLKVFIAHPVLNQIAMAPDEYDNSVLSV